jgi:hypothetical protein
VSGVDIDTAAVMRIAHEIADLSSVMGRVRQELESIPVDPRLAERRQIAARLAHCRKSAGDVASRLRDLARTLEGAAARYESADRRVATMAETMNLGGATKRSAPSKAPHSNSNSTSVRPKRM